MPDRTTTRNTDHAVSRRALIGAGAALGALPLAGAGAAAQDGTPAAPIAPPREAITIILPAEPPVLDPTRTYTIDGWSIVHSVYDTLVFRAADGSLQPLLAESWTEPDPLTIEFRLRTGVTFHNGETFDSRSVVATVQHMQDPATASQVAADFSTIAAVEAVDATTVRFRLTQPSPALLGQVAVYLGMLPPDYVANPNNEFGASAPVGTGPYRFVSWDRGQQVTLEANPNYVANPAKGAALAGTATFRFGGDASTRVADLLAGSADLVRDVPQDQVEGVDGSGTATTLVAPVAGMAFVRIINADQPWANAEIRRAANHAVDVEGIIQALVGGRGQRMATMLTPESIGYDPDLAPYEYDPDRAREIMEEADPEEAFEAIIQITSGASQPIAEAIAAQLVEVGIPAEIEVVDQTTFNEDWKNEDIAMRMLTWRPLFDPQSLFSLMFTTFGSLSLHSDTDLDGLIALAGTDPDPASRAERFREIGRIMHDNPPAIFLWNLTAVYGVSNALTGWQPRLDEYILPLQAQAG